MSNGPGGGGFLVLLLAHAVCCGGLVLVATGAVGGLGAWLIDSGPTLLALLLGVVALGPA